MKKQCTFFCVLWMLSSVSYANWYQDIINAINKQSGITNNILNNELSLQRDMLGTQRDIEKLIGQMNAHMTGHSGYGTYQYHDYQNYGSGASNWASVIKMSGNGQGDGALGQMIGSMARDFPSDRSTYNNGVHDAQAQRYFAMKSQTTLAARAASELDYNKIQEQIAYQQMLLQQIEKTKDLKAATDLNNRIQVEGNLINLEILRQAALLTQQQAITEQGAVMGALSNAKFLNK